MMKLRSDCGGAEAAAGILFWDEYVAEGYGVPIREWGFLDGDEAAWAG